MPCYHPMTAYRSRLGRDPKTGSWPIVFNVKEGFIDKEVVIPCGQCIGCRLERSRIWAMRCVNEASLHESNCFITLTYNDEYLAKKCIMFNRLSPGLVRTGPREHAVNVIDNVEKKYSLNKKEFVLFMKKLRKAFSTPEEGFPHISGIRFFHCGEYGEQFGRPHHHACLFGCDFPDKILWKEVNGVKLYRSALLDEKWGMGYTTIGEVTFESAAYVARYVMKKITGDKAEDHYQGRTPEYITMSRRPGVGMEWAEKYECYIVSVDGVMVRGGIKCRPGRYYDSIYDRANPGKLQKRKEERKRKINEEETYYKRLEVKEKICLSRLKNLKRGLEMSPC